MATEFRNSDLAGAVEALAVTVHNLCIEKGIDVDAPGEMLDRAARYARTRDEYRLGYSMGVLGAWAIANNCFGKSLAQRIKQISEDF